MIPIIGKIKTKYSTLEMSLILQGPTSRFISFLLFKSVHLPESLIHSKLSTVPALSDKKKDARIAASKLFIFFGKALQPTRRSADASQQSSFNHGDMLVNDFVIENTNASPIVCDISLLTTDPADHSYSNELTNDICSLFKFTEDMSHLNYVLLLETLMHLQCSLASRASD